MTHLEILQDFYDTIWTKGDVAQIDRFFNLDTQANGLIPDMTVRPEDFQAMAMALHVLVEDIEFKILHHVEDGPWLAALISASCCSRETGKPATLTGQVMVRFDGDRIAEAHNQTDLFGFFTQMGLLPEDAILRLLAGETVL